MFVFCLMNGLQSLNSSESNLVQVLDRSFRAKMRLKLDIFKLFTEKIFHFDGLSKGNANLCKSVSAFLLKNNFYCACLTFCQGVGLVLEMKLRVGFNSLLKTLWNERTDLILKLVMIRQRWKCQIDKITLKKNIYNKNTNRLNQNLLNYIKLKISWVEVVTRKCDVGDLGQKMNWSKSGRVFTLNSERIARF